MNELAALRMARSREARQRARQFCVCTLKNDATICDRLVCECGHDDACHAKAERAREVRNRRAAS